MRTKLFIVLLLSVLTATATTIIRDTLQYNVSSFTMDTATIDGTTYTIVGYPGLELTHETNMPQLPCQYVRFSVPSDAANLSVTTTASLSSRTAQIPVVPVRKETSDNDSVYYPLVMDSTVYHTNAYYPDSRAEIVGDEYYMGSNRIITVAVYPARYNPYYYGGRIQLAQRIALKLTYDNSPSLNVLVRDDNALRAQAVAEVQAMVVNPSQVAANANVAWGPPYVQPASPYYGGDYQYDPTSFAPTYQYTIIVSNDSMAHAYRRLVALKRQKGYNAGVVKVSDILADPRVSNGDVFYDTIPNQQGGVSLITHSINDDAGKIRQYLKYAFKQGAQYVLFGDSIVPFRYQGPSSDSIYQSIYHRLVKAVPADLYFSDLNTNWNIDNNDFYGEVKYFKGKKSRKFDFSPELFVSRLMATDATHVNNYTNKLLTYELNPGNGNTSYLRRALVTMSHDTTTLHLLACKLIAAYPDTVEIRQHGLVYPTGVDIIDSINSITPAFMTVHGHGTPRSITVIRNTANNSSVSYLTSTEIVDNIPGNSLNCLTNRYKPGVMATWACDNIPFDNFKQPNSSSPSGYNSFPGWNLGQAYTLGKNQGGVAYLGVTRDGFAISGRKWFEHCINLAITDVANIGKMHAYARLLVSNSYGLVVKSSHNLIGDPEFQMWTSEPQLYSTSPPITIVRNNNGISISGITTNGKKSIIGICNATTQLMDSTATGSILINGVSPNSCVMVYQHNFLPYIAPLYLQNERIEESQYVIANDVYAGYLVDSNRTQGDLIIGGGSKYELEYKGHVVLEPGFSVEKGATFIVKPSDY